MVIKNLQFVYKSCLASIALKTSKRYFETEKVMWKINDYKTVAIVVNLQLKRRSGRNVKRKKYMDDVDLNLSDDNTMDLLPTDTEGAVVKPVQLGWRPCCLGTFTNMSLYLNRFGFHMMTSRFALAWIAFFIRRSPIVKRSYFENGRRKAINGYWRSV